MKRVVSMLKVPVNFDGVCIKRFPKMMTFTDERHKKKTKKYRVVISPYSTSGEEIAEEGTEKS